MDDFIWRDRYNIHGNWIAWHFPATWRDRLNDLGAAHMVHVKTFLAHAHGMTLFPTKLMKWSDF